jgi:acyl-CoA reductase-like NAD-dependent aldehyde dehydrogenase
VTAQVFIGGSVPADQPRGWVVAPEEIFGPVLTVSPYQDDRDAVDIANDTQFGLGGSVWSTDVAAPFGGVKASGIGRELGPEGLAAYQTLKSIYRVGPSD